MTRLCKLSAAMWGCVRWSSQEAGFAGNYKEARTHENLSLTLVLRVTLSRECVLHSTGLHQSDSGSNGLGDPGCRRGITTVAQRAHIWRGGRGCEWPPAPLGERGRHRQHSSDAAGTGGHLGASASSGEVGSENVNSWDAALVCGVPSMIL